jgi:4-hydroxyphenylpyruvate dioxygenase
LNHVTNGRPVNPYSGFDHLKFTVTNAKQAASYYCTRLGFQHVAYRGLETGCRESASHVVKQGDAIFVFESPIHPDHMKEMAAEIARRGDGVKDVAFTVKDCRAVYTVRCWSFIFYKYTYFFNRKQWLEVLNQLKNPRKLLTRMVPSLWLH